MLIQRLRLIPWLLLPVCGMSACKSPQTHRAEADKAASDVIAEKQQSVLHKSEPFTIEKPADTLRKRLMLRQELVYSNPASLGVKSLKPIRDWPDAPYLDTARDVPDPSGQAWESEYEFAAPSTQPSAPTPHSALHLTLADALQVAAYNSRTYQDRKESVYQTAIALDLARDEFRASWAAFVNGQGEVNLSGEDDVAGVVLSPGLSVDQRFASGLRFTGALAFDLAKLLTGDRQFSRGVLADLSISMPLLRGAGSDIVLEPLTQAERDVAYSLLSFEQFKRSFAVDIASSYLGVLQAQDTLDNSEQSYKRLVINSTRSRRLADAGRLPEIQVDQAVQEELRGRERWIVSQLSYSRQLDQFKVQLGLPPDALVALDRAELTRLQEIAAAVVDKTVPGIVIATQPTTAPVLEPSTLEKPVTDAVQVRRDDERRGRLEIPEAAAVLLAMEHRPDLRVSQGSVFDAQRRVRVAADALRAGLELTAGGTAGGRRGALGAAADDAELRFEDGRYDIGLAMDLPLERTAQRNIYRNTLIALEKAVRSFQDLEDQVKLAIRNRLRDLASARESVQVQAKALAVAERRVRSTDMFLQAGRAAVRDVLESQTSLLNAQNAFTAALVDYRLSELELQRDMGLLVVDHEGRWTEYRPAGAPATRPASRPAP